MPGLYPSNAQHANLVATHQRGEKSERNMTRWFVGVKHDGGREVFAESTGTDPTAQSKGYKDICGPYNSERDAVAAAKGKSSVHGGSLRNRSKKRAR
jgi:hypothetical protein